MMNSATPAATLGLLAMILVSMTPAQADGTAALSRSPFMTVPPLVTETPDQLARRAADFTDFPSQLDPRIWKDDSTMRPEVTSRAMAIVNRMFDGLHLHNKTLDVADIELFGSNASFEYDDMADLGIHVFLNTARNPTSYNEDISDLERFMKLFTDAIELEQKGEVNFYGIPVTIVFHATRPPGFRDTDGQPQYSIWSSDPSRTGRWINPKTPPPVPPKDAFDVAAIIAKTQDFSNQYNELATAYFKDKQGFDCKQFGALNRIVRAYRTDGIAEDGQRSNGNLTFRLLRRLSVDVPDTLLALDRECRNIKDSLF